MLQQGALLALLAILLGSTRLGPQPPWLHIDSTYTQHDQGLQCLGFRISLVCSDNARFGFIALDLGCIEFDPTLEPPLVHDFITCLLGSFTSRYLSLCYFSNAAMLHALI